MILARFGALSSRKQSGKEAHLLVKLKLTSLTRCQDVHSLVRCRWGCIFVLPFCKTFIRFTRIISIGPPQFHHHYRTGGCVHQIENSEALVDVATRLFPHGIPNRNQKWIIPDGVSPSEYEAFLRKVFIRTVPTPISVHGRSQRCFISQLNSEFSEYSYLTRPSKGCPQRRVVTNHPIVDGTQQNRLVYHFVNTNFGALSFS